MVPLTLFCFVCLFLGTYIYTCVDTHTHTHTHILKCICDGFVEWDISINKDVTVISDLGPPNVNEDPQKGKQSLLSSRCHPHSIPSDCWGALRKFRECEKPKTPRMLALDSRDAYERNDFNNPRLLYLPIHRRALNSLTWDVCFSLINGNLWCSHCLLPFVTNSCISWLHPLPPQSRFSGLPEMLPPGLEVLTFPSNKTPSTFRYFLDNS